MDNSQRLQGPFLRKRTASERTSPEDALPSVALLVAIEPGVHRKIAEMLAARGVECLFAGSIAEMKSVCAHRNISVCVSGLWMVDGTFRDAVNHLRRQASPVRVIIVCDADSPPEYRAFLRALDIDCFDPACASGQKGDWERALESAIADSQEAKSDQAGRTAHPSGLDAHSS